MTMHERERVSGPRQAPKLTTNPRPDAPIVVVLGASTNPERYSFQAVQRLAARGYRVIPVHPKYSEVAGVPVTASLSAIQSRPVDTITVYVRPEISSGLADVFFSTTPRRVIFNPGSENPELANRLRQTGIQVEISCTLVLLATGQF